MQKSWLVVDVAVGLGIVRISGFALTGHRFSDAIAVDRPVERGDGIVDIRPAALEECDRTGKGRKNATFSPKSSG